MSSIWHVIEAVVRWLYAHLASVGISAVVTAIGGAVMWFLGFRKAKLNNQKLALEIDHIKIDTKRPGAPGAEGCPTHSRSLCLVPRHPLRFVPGHPLQLSVRNREYKASGPPSTADFADPIPESKCDSSTPTLAVRPPADKPARRPERG